MIYERLRKFKVGQFAYRTRELFTLTMRPEDADERGGVGGNEFITRPTNWVRLRNTGSVSYKRIKDTRTLIAME